MKRVILLLLVGFLGVSVFAQTGSILVQVSGIENENGLIQIALFRSDSGFPDSDKSLKGVSPKAVLNELSHTFNEIESGTYAVAIFHDENSNNELDTNAIGIPKESFGFSNNAKGSFGPPKFKAASFTVEDNKQAVLKIKLMNLSL